MDFNIEHLDSWKNRDVSQKQLELNLKELSDKKNYPPHWWFFINFIEQHDIKSIIDLGCGVGAYYKLLKDNNIEIEYLGIDYSDTAIEVAKKQWNSNNFISKDLWNLTKEDVKNYDLVHMGALLDVLPNADEALEHILSIEPKTVLISRILISNKEPMYEVYEAYNTIKTYSFTHNQKILVKMFQKHNYEFEFLENNVFLYKKNGK